MIDHDTTFPNKQRALDRRFSHFKFIYDPTDRTTGNAVQKRGDEYRAGEIKIESSVNWLSFEWILNGFAM